MSATWPEALAALAMPPGVPGSGRQRYGAAMTLWREGLIAHQVLEVYRIASAMDAQDPVPMLAEAGLPRPGTEIAAMVAVARALIAGCAGEGIAEVLAGLDAAHVVAPAPVPNALVAARLPAALAALSGAEARGPRPAAAAPSLTAPASPPTPLRFAGGSGERLVSASGAASAAQMTGAARPRPVPPAGGRRVAPSADPVGLADAIRAAAPWLAWMTYDRYPQAEIGPAFAQGHAFAPVATGSDFELGLFLVAPGVFYRDHAHAAPELYLPLTGPHGWRFAPGGALDWQPARTPVWNPPHRPYAVKVGDVPFLCLYAWTADKELPAYVLAAPDWDALEAS